VLPLFGTSCGILPMFAVSEGHRMTSAWSSRKVLDWLAGSGWSPGRDIGRAAEELIRVRVKDSERQGASLAPVEAAVRIVHSYGMLRLNQPHTPGCAWVMKPTIGYDGDAAAIKELGNGLGVELFPVGYEASEYGIVLVDERGRFFLLHHTGGYFLGENDFDAFDRFIRGGLAPDAEDYFV
jgi:hypothetical protein